MPSASLPSLPELTTDLINELDRFHHDGLGKPVSPINQEHGTDSLHLNSLTNLSSTDKASAKSLLMTLHILFPHELIPALDILDRKLVLELIISTEPSTSDERNGEDTHGRNQESYLQAPPSSTFYVRSASSVPASMIRPGPDHSSHSYSYNHPIEPSGGYYAVHLDSWNCSCPAFAFSSFGKTLAIASETPQLQLPTIAPVASRNFTNEGRRTRLWRFGGTLTSQESGVRTPVCKHILAACFAKHAPTLFGNAMEKRQVTSEELAGWGGGWGD